MSDVTITPTPDDGNDTNNEEKDYKPFLGAKMDPDPDTEGFEGDEFDDV